MRPRSDPAWWYLGAGAAGTIAFYLVSEQPSAVLYDLFGAAAAVALFIGARSRPPTERLPWYLLALGVVGWVAGDSVWTAYQLIGREAPYPSYADVSYLIAYPLWIVGLLLFVRHGGKRSDPTVLLDAIIVMISGGVASWLLVIEPAIAGEPRLTLAVAVTVAYPVMDVLLLGLLVRLLLAPTTDRTVHRLLVTGLVATLVADTAYSIAIINGTYTNQAWMDLGWLVFYTTWGLAGLRSASSGRARRLVPVGPSIWVSLLSFAFAAITLLAAFLAADLQHGGAGIVLVIAAAVPTLTLLGVRFAIAMRRAEGDRRRLDLQRERLEDALVHLRRVEGERTELLDQTVRAAEEERARIAVELHDGPLQHLAALSFRIGLARAQLQTSDIQSADGALARAELELSDDIGELRRLMRDLRPPALDEWGLEGALRDHCEVVARRIGTPVRLEYERGPLPHDTEIVLYRIAQEALSNVARHAGATEVEVHVVARGGQASLMVRDDGAGFDASDEGPFSLGGHLGLAGMAQRASMVGGTLRVRSEPGAGTTVSVLVPHAVAA